MTTCDHKSAKNTVLLPRNRNDYEIICEDCYVSQRDQWELERFKLTDYHDILICSLCEGTPSRFDDDFECNICFKCTKSHTLAMNEIMAASIGKLPQFDLPTAIIEGSVFLGSHQASVSDDYFTNANITHILVCCTHLPQHHNQSNQFRYHRLPIHDSVTEILSVNLLMNACQFIDDALLKKEAVLIHCHAGVSRSATITIAWLMKSKKWSFEESFAFVKAKRSCISPNSGFIRQLKEWEEFLLSLGR
jgi:hypothetical protein